MSINVEKVKVTKKALTSVTNKNFFRKYLTKGEKGSKITYHSVDREQNEASHHREPPLLRGGIALHY